MEVGPSANNVNREAKREASTPSGTNGAQRKWWDRIACAVVKKATKPWLDITEVYLSLKVIRRTLWSILTWRPELMEWLISQTWPDAALEGKARFHIGSSIV